MLRTTLLCLIFSISLYSVLPGQDVSFSQFFAAPLHLNPGLVGVTDAPRFTLNYRDQWPNWPNAYRTYAFAYEQPLNALNSGVGLRILTDDAGRGIYKTTAISGVYGYHIKMRDDLSVRIGIDAGVFQTRLDWDKLLFGDQLDPVTGNEGNQLTQENRPENLERTVVDFSTGLVVYGRRFYGGIALHHLNRPDESLLNINDNLRAGRPLRMTAHVGAQFSAGPGNIGRGQAFVSPSILYMRQGGFSQLTAGAYTGYKSVFGGLWYRHAGQNPDAIIGLVGFRYQTIRIGYSYDLTVSGLSVGTTGGTHEVSFTISLADSDALARKRRATRYNDCFALFK